MVKGYLFLFVLLSSLLLSACSSAPKGLTADVFEMSNYLKTSTQIDTLLTDQTMVNILDVRTPAEFQTECLKGARNIDFEATDFEQNIAGLDKNADYLVYCRSGRRSALAVAKMRAIGINNIIELKGGINAWKSDGKKVVNNCR